MWRKMLAGRIQLSENTLLPQDLDVSGAINTATDGIFQLLLGELELLPDGMLHRHITGTMGSFRPTDNSTVHLKPSQQISALSALKAEFGYQTIKFLSLDG